MKLSEKAKFLREYSKAELLSITDEANLLTGLYEAFKQSLLPQLEKEYFADIYAQTLTYGLFLSALNCNDPKAELNKSTAYSLLPSTFPLIKELFHSLDNFPAEIVWSVDEIISILKVTDFIAIKKEFSEYRHKELGFNDPFIFFYEDFLKHYDSKQREIRGVYYTPEPVVSFIVRSIEVILKDTFGIQDGFINKDVTLLDFASGTGTFLLNAFKQAIEQAMKLGDKQTVNKILNEKVINNFYGFELLVAPYVIAHLKISEYLKEQGYTIEQGKRLNIYLTNTLSNKKQIPVPILPNLSKEGQEAYKVKNRDILIVMGNPPYSVGSSNKEGYIAEQKMNRYKLAVKTERNIQPLSDDYIKFIRFAHWKMENVERGVIGIITNNSFIDGLIHRGMRQELMKDFDEIYILNLHGNARIGEKCPDGSKDENVFDIMQGVCISFFVKKTKGNNKQAKVFYQELFGLRKEKYSDLLAKSIVLVNWIEIKPEKKNYFFNNKVFKSALEYENRFKIDEMFIKNSCGIVTSNDKELVSFFKQNLTNEYLYNYRPFDERFINYDLKKVQRARFDIMKNVLNVNDNISLIVSKQYGNHKYFINFIADKLTDKHSQPFAPFYLFPLYVINEKAKSKTKLEKTEEAFPVIIKTDNFTKEFRQYIKTKYRETYTPEQILGYIYAVLHSPAYRAKYIEFLKIDFPRVPFTDDEELFSELSSIGFELIEHHLMKKTYSANICKLNGAGNNFKVEKVEYQELKEHENPEADFLLSAKGEKSGKVWINKERYFEPVPESIWQFYIGGYQVLDKWLKERKKHEITLSAEDIQHFIKVVSVLDETIRTMQKIDVLTREWI